ncbi:MAG: sodium/substrate symporter small subunit [Bacteroidota bacterium]
MENQNDNYNISFFKPTTELAKINRNLTIKLLIIWVVAIFGFHFLLKIIETPTPEPAYIAYKEVWDNVKSGNASVEEKQVFLKSALSVLGKLLIQADDRMILDKAVSPLAYQLVPEQTKESFFNQVTEFNKLKNEITSLSDEKYVALKGELIDKSASLLGLNIYSLEAKLMPFELISTDMKSLDTKNNELVEGVMSKYLIHNQSFLTDFKFLGFPFHYFYTAVFLLILFVGLCWFYCYRTDKIHKELGIEA